MNTLDPTLAVEAFLYRLHTSPETITITKRQAEKFSRRLERIKNHGDLKQTISHVTKIAQQRAEHAGPSVYIANIGSSGSHWLQALLTHAGGLLPSGETYFPEAQLDAIEGNDLVKKIYIHAVYLIMGWSSPAEKISAGAVNTAHKPYLSHVKAIDTGAKSILLVRDPVDVVMSRTFRKNEFRKYLGNENMDDMEYLKSNARSVRSFYRKALRNKFDITVRYEDIRENGPKVIEDVFEAIDLSVDKDKILKVLEMLRNDSTPGSKAAPPAEEHVYAAKFITEEVRSKLGYT